ncbi:MAG TPA: ComEC/Rec2 family competence protein [Mycobacteriales bacterium]|nr:ComEC/Rec2 family competence protein [Mycobacteriales bacterium]
MTATPGQPPRAGQVGGPPLDLRLLPAAVAAWLVTWLGLGWSPTGSILVGCGCAAVAGALVRSDRPTRRAAGLALGCAAIAAVLVGVRVHARGSSPLRGLASVRAAATVWLVVRADPRPLRPHGVTGVPRVAVPARALRVRSGGRGWRLRADVLVLAPAGGWSGLLPSQHLRVTGRVVPARSGDLTVAVLSVRGPPSQVGPPSVVQRAAGRLRHGLRDAATVLPTAERGLLPGLVLGDTSGLDPTVAADFRVAGLAHLLAVSGANVTIVVGAVLLLCRLFRADPRFTAAVSGLALAGFVVLVRPSPSVLRAAMMGAIALLALATGRTRQGVPALAGTALVLVLLSPDLARSAGFALSVGATGALLVLAPRWGAGLRRAGVPPWLADAVAVPAAAYLTTAPIIAALAGRVSLVGIPANLLAAPAVPVATVLGVLATVLGPASPAAARAVAWLAGLPTAWLAAVGRQASGVRLAALPWPSGWTGFWLLVPMTVAGLACVRFRAVRRGVLAAAVAALLVTVPARSVLLTWPPAGWMLVACDVGQGDALVLNAGPGSAVVVDTGPDPALVDHCLRRLGVRRVPLLLLTHLHADHAGGVVGVLRGRQVAAIETGPLHQPTWEWDNVRRAAATHRIPLLPVHMGETWRLGGVGLEVLAPAHAFHRTRSDPNNSSLVLRVTDRGHTLLLTGDVEVEAQQEILGRETDLHAELLKVPHHGSAHSDPRFLAATRARVGVISVGAGNDYGHPSPVLLAELARLGMRVYRTDRDGDIAACDRHGNLVMVTRSHRVVGRPAVRR